MRLLFSLIILAKILLLTACSPQPPEIGCQQFSELVDDVALSVQQPGRLLESVSGETVMATIDNPNFNRRPGESEEERSGRFALWLGAGVVVIRLEFMAQEFFHEDHEMSRPAYMLWKSAAVQESGGSRDRLPSLETAIYAERLGEICKDRGYPVPESNTVVIADYLEIAIANK